MTQDEKEIIRAYSLGDVSLKQAAIAIYRTEVIAGRTGGPEMRFMAEVDTQMYDFLARARARERLHDLIAQDSIFMSVDDVDRIITNPLKLISDR